MRTPGMVASLPRVLVASRPTRLEICSAANRQRVARTLRAISTPSRPATTEQARPRATEQSLDASRRLARPESCYIFTSPIGFAPHVPGHGRALVKAQSCILRGAASTSASSLNTRLQRLPAASLR